MSETQPPKNEAVMLLRAILAELQKMNKRAEPPKPKPRNLPPPPSPADDPTQPKKKLVFNEAINSWQWENDK